MNITSHTSSIAHRIRRYGSAGSLLAFPALLVVEAPLDPAPGGTGEVMLTAASDHAGALLASAVVVLHEVMPSSTPSVEIGALCVLTVVFGYLGVRIARLTDTEWGPVPQARAAFAALRR